MNPDTALVRRFEPALLALPTAQEWDTMKAIASAIHQSGMYPRKAPNVAAALMVILTGRELGVGITQALRSIDYIEGQPAPSPELMAALIYDRHGDDALDWVVTNERIATCAYKRKGWATARQYSFSIEDAQRAKLTHKDNWQKYPAAMLRARCVSAIGKMAFQDVVLGLYTPDELGAITDVEGHVIEGNPPPIAPPAPATVEPDRPSEAQYQELAAEVDAPPVSTVGPREDPFLDPPAPEPTDARKWPTKWPTDAEIQGIGWQAPSARITAAVLDQCCKALVCSEDDFTALIGGTVPAWCERNDTHAGMLVAAALRFKATGAAIPDREEVEAF